MSRIREPHYISYCHDCHIGYPLTSRICPMCDQQLEAVWSERGRTPDYLLVWLAITGLGLGALLVLGLLTNTN